MLGYYKLKASVWYHANFGPVTNGFQFYCLILVRHTTEAIAFVERKNSATYLFDIGQWHVLLK